MRPDPEFARSHAAGASVMVTQILEHERLGAIAYEWPRFWPAFLIASRKARDELRAVHDRIATEAPGSGGSRTMLYEFIEPAIAAHAQMVVGAVPDNALLRS